MAKPDPEEPREIFEQKDRMLRGPELAIFHPFDLVKHEEEVDWIDDDKIRETHFKKGELVYLPLFNSSDYEFYEIRFTDIGLDKDESKHRRASFTFRFECKYGRVFIGNRLALPAFEEGGDPLWESTYTDEADGDGEWADLETGSYQVTVHRTMGCFSVVGDLGLRIVVEFKKVSKLEKVKMPDWDEIVEYADDEIPTDLRKQPERSGSEVDTLMGRAIHETLLKKCQNDERMSSVRLDEFSDVNTLPLLAQAAADNLNLSPENRTSFDNEENPISKAVFILKLMK